MSVSSYLSSVSKLSRILKQPIKMSLSSASFMSTYIPKLPPIPWLEPKLESVKEQFRKYEGGEVSLTLNEESGIAYLLLSHETKRNSLSGKMMVQLHDAIEKLETWETGRGLILYTSGDMFCSGAYLETVKQLSTPEDGFRMSCLMHDALIRLRSLPLVSVAIVQGKAMGGGAELPLSTDFRLITPETEIKYVQAIMGITTGWGGGQFLRSLVGHNKALDFLLTGRTIHADEAIQIGLADSIVQHETRVEESVSWLNSKIGSHDATVVRANKLTMVCSSFAQERQILSTLWMGDIQKNKLSLSLKHK